MSRLIRSVVARASRGLTAPAPPRRKTAAAFQKAQEYRRNELGQRLIVAIIFPVAGRIFLEGLVQLGREADGELHGRPVR